MKYNDAWNMVLLTRTTPRREEERNAPDRENRYRIPIQ
jgi:hypothetical protein